MDIRAYAKRFIPSTESRIIIDRISSAKTALGWLIALRGKRGLTMARLIDADALKEAFEEDGHLSGYIEEFIDDMPTITPEPVKGEWERYSLTALGTEIEWYRLRCSQCGLMPVGDIRSWNFCPHCGADMRKEERHEPEDGRDRGGAEI